MFSSLTVSFSRPELSAKRSSGFVVDIGGTKLLIGVARQGNIAETRSLQTAQFAGPADMMDAIAATCRQLSGTLDMAIEPAVVAVPGRLDRESGTVLQAANLPLSDFPLAAELSKRLDGAPVRIEHDAVCGLIGETSFGAARGLANVIYLTVSTGISVGVLVDGALLEGAHGAAGELGHTPVESPGIACPCGSSGCLEAYASGRALAELGQQAAAGGSSPALAARLATGRVITAREVLSAARRGDRVSATIVEHAVRLLARAIQLLVMTLDPELVVLGGGVMSNSYFADHIIASARLAGDRYPRVRRAQLGARSVLYGGVLLLERWERRQQSAANESPLKARNAEKGGPGTFTATVPSGLHANSDTARQPSQTIRSQPQIPGVIMPHKDLNVAVLTRHRYQELELWFPLLRYREVGATTSLVGRAAVEHLGGVGYPAIPDQIVGEGTVPAVLIVPGRAPAPEGADAAVEELTSAERDLLHAVHDAGGVLAAIGDGVAVLGAAGLLEGRTVASNDTMAGQLAGFGASRATDTVHADSAIVTAAGADDLPAFVTAIDAAALGSS